MKFLPFLLLFSSLAFADVRVNIKNLQGEITHSAKFESQTLADDWITKQSPTGSWGQLERWLSESQAQADGLSIAGKDTRAVTGPDGTEVIEYMFPQTFTVETVDASAEAAAELKIKKRVEFEAFGKDFKRWVQILNEDSGVTPAQVLALRADPRMKTANELAEGGDIPTLKYHIETTDWTGLFPPSVVSAALQKVNTFMESYP